MITQNIIYVAEFMYKGGRYIVTSKKIVGFGNDFIKPSKFQNGLQ